MKTEVINIDPLEPQEEKIKHAASVLVQGGLVAIPTETVYGIAANMLNNQTIQRLYNIKQRPKDKPFSIHIAEKEDVEKYAMDIQPSAYRLMDEFWPGPITLVLKSKENQKIGIRMPNHKVSLSIIKEASVPVVCPSANLSGKPPPKTLKEVLRDFDSLIELAIDAGETEIGIESTVIDLTITPFQILREGAISKEEIEKIINTKTVLFVCTGNSCRSVVAKALLEKKLKERGRKDIRVLSAGIMMVDNLEPSYQIARLLTKEGMDISSHRSKTLNKDMIKKSDIILVMEKLHEERVLKLAPEVKFRVFLLKEFAKINGDLDIADPIGRPPEFYEQTFITIKEAIERISSII